MFIVLQILSSTWNKSRKKKPRAEHALKQLSVELWNVPTFWNLQALKSLLGPKSSTDATSNEVMEADDDEVEQTLRLTAYRLI